MDRRRFLLATASFSAAAFAGGFAPSLRAAATCLAVQHQLLRLDGVTQCFLPVAHVPGGRAGTDAQRLEIDAFMPAANSNITGLRMEALFGDAQKPWRHRTWHYEQDDRLGSSRATGFDLGVDAFRGLALQWETNDAATPMQCVAAAELAALGPGRYLLMLGDSVVGDGGLPFSGDWQHPLTQAGGNCFSLRVETVMALPDLSARADLACMVCEDEAVAA